MAWHALLGHVPHSRTSALSHLHHLTPLYHGTRRWKLANVRVNRQGAQGKGRGGLTKKQREQVGGQGGVQGEPARVGGVGLARGVLR